MKVSTSKIKDVLLQIREFGFECDAHFSSGYSEEAFCIENENKTFKQWIAYCGVTALILVPNDVSEAKIYTTLDDYLNDIKENL